MFDDGSCQFLVLHYNNEPPVLWNITSLKSQRIYSVILAHERWCLLQKEKIDSRIKNAMGSYEIFFVSWTSIYLGRRDYISHHVEGSNMHGLWKDIFSSTQGLSLHRWNILPRRSPAFWQNSWNDLSVVAWGWTDSTKKNGPRVTSLPASEDFYKSFKSFGSIRMK